jgi:carnitine O-acetyltransferase
LKLSISHKKSAKITNGYKLRNSIEKTLKDLFILFPKRSEIWGIGFEAKFAQEKKDEAYIAKMRKLSDEIKANEISIEKKYKRE